MLRHQPDALAANTATPGMERLFLPPAWKQLWPFGLLGSWIQVVFGPVSSGPGPPLGAQGADLLQLCVLTLV